MTDQHKKQRVAIRTGTPWEPIVGYSRAVRVGEHIAVSGCAPVDDQGELVGPNDMYLQTQRCIAIIEKALTDAGAELRHVIRTRIFVTDIKRWEEVARAHQEAFAGIMPATSMLEVSRLIGEDMLVEIEVDAICPED